MLNRRQFLKVLGISTLALGNQEIFAFFDSPGLTDEQKALLKGIQIIDAHAHPDRYLTDHRFIDNSSTVKTITELGMAASVFSFVGLSREYPSTVAARHLTFIVFSLSSAIINYQSAIRNFLLFVYCWGLSCGRQQCRFLTIRLTSRGIVGTCWKSAI